MHTGGDVVCVGAIIVATEGNDGGGGGGSSDGDKVRGRCGRRWVLVMIAVACGGRKGGRGWWRGWRWQSDGGVKVITVWAQRLTVPRACLPGTPVVVRALGGGHSMHKQKARWQLVTSDMLVATQRQWQRWWQR